MLHRIAEAAGSRYSGTREVIKDGRKGGNQWQVYRFYGGGNM